MTSPSNKSEMPGTVRVDWNDVDLVAKMKKKGGIEEKQILTKVSGFAVPGELLAIMGPSGAGKTSLLNVLAVRTAPTSGELSFNASQYSKSLQGRVAYVHQQEMLLEAYTPREHLLFQSTLRMPRDVTKAQREQRVDACIKMLGLEKCQHSLIGDVYHGISKNEKRRVTFATEILTQPAVLYCDEPTTGLDSVMAEVIVKYMKAIAEEGQKGQKVTVIASIHQPSSQVFRLFDRLHFLVDGRTAYFGAVSKLESYFESIGYTMPDHTMPADFVMRLCIDPRDPEGAASRRVAISDAWDKQWPNEDARANGAPIGMLPKDKSEVFDSDRQTNWCMQLVHLTKREVIMKVRSKADLRSALLRTLVLGVLFGLTFLQLEKRQSALFTINGCLFFTMMMGVMNICMSAAMGIPTRLPTLIREHRNGAYGVPAMYLSKALADAPFDFLIALLWSSLMYWMVGFRDDFGHYLYFFVVVYALTIVATGVGYLGGYTAPVAAIGMLVVLLNIMPQMLFGGLFMNLNSVPPGFIWLKTISIFRLGFEALMINQWQDYGVLDCSNEPVCVAADGEAVLSRNGIDPAASYAGAILWLLIPLCVYHSLAFLILWRRAQPRQFEGAAPEDDTKGELRRESEEQQKLSSIERPEILLQWFNLSVEASRADVNGTSKQVKILEGNAGNVAPGELLAIMGPSGSGKSTLLKSLAGIAELPLCQGSDVMINGKTFSEEVREHSAFLFQDEQLFGNLTVREHLLFQCRFRMGRLPKSECVQRSDALITELGLAKCKNTLIGAIGAGISGGERRRLAFATELLTEPTLLFADEATSGLDSAMALNVMKLLHGFARGEGTATQKTVLATIHQPSEEVFNLFDKVLILVEGRTVYFGSPGGALQHYSSLSLQCPRDESPPDFFMRCVATDAGEDADRQQAKQNVETLLKALPPLATPDMPKKFDPKVESLKGSGVVALLTLVRREFLIRRRSKILFKAAIARTLFMAILLGLLYWQLPNDQDSWQSVLGVLNMIMINTFMTSGFGLTQELPHSFRPAFREARAGMYSISACFWSKTLGDLPVDVIGPLIGSSLIFAMTGVGKTAESYFLFVMWACVTSVIGNTWGYLASAAGGRAEYAFAIFLLSVFPFMIFNGYMMTTEEIPIYFRWIEYVGPFKPIFAELNVAIWTTRTLDCPAQGPCPFRSGEDVLRLRGMDEVDHVYNYSIIIGLYLLGCRLLGWGIIVLRWRLGASNVAVAAGKKSARAKVHSDDSDEVAHSNVESP